MRATFNGPAILLVLFAAGCANTEKKLEDVSWSEAFPGDYDAVVAQAKYVLCKRFPKGFDPDRTQEEKGDFWTIWHYYKSTMYWSGTRARAHVVVEQVGKGKCRVGISVVRQRNADIDNPGVMKEARWIKTERDDEMASLLERAIARRYLTVEPSNAWKEKHRTARRTTLRDDLVDRYRDVDLEGEGVDRAKNTKTLPSITGRKDFWDPTDPLGRKKKREEEEERNPGRH